MKAVLLGVKSLSNNMSNIHLQVQLDNTTSVTYINNIGGTISVKVYKHTTLKIQVLVRSPKTNKVDRWST